ncbi:hypothetical protein OG413_45990 [Streptomyces sp. NBC_01433]|uniref:hypothetical protein n=1 Tax=Streptomyces sp. NBC_01433 TaxID=2903864 RepID=UPI00224C7E8D|nr:hypothetical protein [Streptomyces sp. NBC_01433]MCX4682485.1 hypothetical protein [Streptomyces sp. NBC_01433]MCX4682538.1 hypothetical protein [Streptomyces sp. NBC_01433]
MTTDKQFKRAARELAEREGISYTAARRRLAADPETAVSAPLTTAPAAAEDDQEPTPPRLYPIARAVCATDCDGTPHPGALCHPWRPEDSKHVRSRVRRAAQLPNGRAGEIYHRFEPPAPGHPYGSFFARDATWLLALVYAMLTDQHPELRPGRAELRTAVEADDQAAVDAVMEPLDRAAARLLTKVPERWWGEVKPQLQAYADFVDADDREIRSWQEADERHEIGRLVDKWRRAWTESRNYNGYMEAPGVLWLAPKGWLDDLLVEQHGGHGDGARVRLADGRPAIVYAAEWSEAGAPVAYRIRELEPGRHGNVGKLVPSLTSDELVPRDQVAGELNDVA